MIGGTLMRLGVLAYRPGWGASADIQQLKEPETLPPPRITEPEKLAPFAVASPEALPIA
jgi:hypothetical protein